MQKYTFSLAIKTVVLKTTINYPNIKKSVASRRARVGLDVVSEGMVRLSAREEYEASHTTISNYEAACGHGGCR